MTRHCERGAVSGCHHALRYVRSIVAMVPFSWRSRKWIFAFLWSLVPNLAAIHVAFGAESSSQLLNVELVADGLVAPLDLTFAPNNDSGRRYIVDQNGLILILTPENEVLMDEPSLNITDRVVLSSAFDERGLLGVAFHPMNKSKVYALYSAERSSTQNICLDRERISESTT